MARTVAPEELPLVLKWLDGQLPLSLKMRGEVHAVITGRAAIGGTGNDFIMTPAGWTNLAAADAASGQISAAITRRRYHGGEGDGRLRMSLFATDAAAATELLALAESGLEPPPSRMFIAGLDRHYLPLAEQLASVAGGTEYWCVRCVQMWQPVPMPPPAPPAGVALGPLTVADGPLVNDTWTFGGSDASLRDQVLPCIRGQRTLGLRTDIGELVSWALRDHPDGAMSKVFTLEAQRRLGYSLVVCGQLAAEIQAAGESKPYCFIVEDNATSQALFSRLGFEACGPGVAWLGWTKGAACAAAAVT